MTVALLAQSKMPDPSLDAVFTHLSSRSDLGDVIAKALRQSLDEVIDGPRTGRYCVEQLEKTEKTYIGTKVEIVLRDELALERGKVLDNLIQGYEVDTKFSLSGGWMIPREAVGQICLLVTGNDHTGLYSVGLLRTTLEVLTRGQNQDGKKSVSAVGKQNIRWLLHQQPMIRNFLFDIDDSVREAVLSPTSGKARLKALFRKVNGQIIPRSAILQVAQLKGDPLRRAREAKEPLAAEGIQVLCAAYMQDREDFLRNGFFDFKDDDWLSIRVQDASV